MSKNLSAALIVGVAVALVAVQWCTSPGFYAGFILAPVGRAVMIFSVLWLAGGFFLLLKTESILRVFVAIFLVVSTSLIFMLAPAVITILNAIGPITEEPAKK